MLGGTNKCKEVSKMEWINQIKQKIDKNKQTAGQNNQKKITEATITKTTINGKQKIQTTENQTYTINATKHPIGTKLKIKIKKPDKQNTSIEILDNDKTEITKRKIILDLAEVMTKLSDKNKESDDYVIFSGEDQPQQFNKQGHIMLWEQYTILLNSVRHLIKKMYTGQNELSEQEITEILKEIIKHPYGKDNGISTGDIDG